MCALHCISSVAVGGPTSHTCAGPVQAWNTISKLHLSTGQANYADADLYTATLCTTPALLPATRLLIASICPPHAA